MSKLPFIVAAVVTGALISLQPGLNAEVARRIGSPFTAAFLSTSVAFAFACAYMLVTRQPIPFQAIAALPPYLWIAGLIGFGFVIAALWLAPILGAALLFAAIVAGQMIAATVADHVGFAGYQAQTFDPMRLVGIGLVLAGIVILQRTA